MKTCRGCGRLVCQKRKNKRFYCRTCRGKGKRGPTVIRVVPRRLGRRTA